MLQSRKSESRSSNAPVYKAIRPESTMNPQFGPRIMKQTHTRSWDSKMPAPRRHTKLSPGKESCLVGSLFLSPTRAQGPMAEAEGRRGLKRGV